MAGFGSSFECLSSRGSGVVIIRAVRLEEWNGLRALGTRENELTSHEKSRLDLVVQVKEGEKFEICCL